MCSKVSFVPLVDPLAVEPLASEDDDMWELDELIICGRFLRKVGQGINDVQRQDIAARLTV